MPLREYHFWVYILSSRSRNLYIGTTNNLKRRTATHRERLPGTHAGKYAIHRLVYFEYFRYVRTAISREKQLKHWTREQKNMGGPVLKLQEPSVPDRPKADSLRE